MSGNSDQPKGWASAKIEELCQFNPKHPRDTPEDRELSFVPMEAVSSRSGTIVNASERSFGEIRKGFTHFSEGDVIWAKITPCMENGKSAVATKLKNGMACGSTEFMVFRSRGGIDANYLHRFMRQESYRSAAKRTMKSGVGQARVPKTFVLESELPIPPLNEQRRIVSKIESLESHREAAQEALDAIPPLLEKFRQSVLAAAFRGELTREWRAQNPDVEPASVLLERIRTKRKARFIEDAAETARAKAEAKARDAGKPWADADDQKVLEKERDKAEKKYKEPEPVDATDLPELPEGWCWASVDEIASSLDQGWSPKCLSEPAPDDQTWGVIKTTAVQHLRFDAEHNKALPSSLTERERLEIQSGDLLVTRAGPRVRVGVCCHVREVRPRLMICDKVYRLRTIQSCVRPEFVELALNTKRIVDLLERLKTGIDDSGVNLTQNKFRSLPIPLAPHDEQRAISEAVESALTFSDGILERVSTTDSLRGQLGQSLLARAFRGELVPQDPNDEPAGVLLERIRTERAEADSQGKSKRKAARKTTKKAARKKSAAKASS